MLLGFQKRFEPYVMDGSKTHTIRATRKRGVRVGEICHCYGDTRQKTMHLLGRWPCVKVEYIEIHPPGCAGWTSSKVFIEGQILSMDECEALAWRDGFRNEGFWEMMHFWCGRLPFRGQIIHWDYRRPVPDRVSP